MIKVLIAGTTRTGKSHVLLCLAKILSNYGLKVLAVDTTKHCGMQNFFHLHPELEARESTNEPLVICRDGFDIMLIGSVPDKKSLDECSQDYDAVLVEAERITMGMAGQFTHAVFLQDCNMDSLTANQNLLQAFREANPEIPVRLLLNLYLPCKLSVKYICHTLGISMENLDFLLLNIHDLATGYNQKVDGRIRLKSHTPEHNRILFKLACELQGIENNRKDARRCLTN